MEAAAGRPMLPGNHIKVTQSLNAAFCLQSGASCAGATQNICQTAKTDKPKELDLWLAECNFQIFRQKKIGQIHAGEVNKHCHWTASAWAPFKVAINPEQPVALKWADVKHILVSTCSPVNII